MEVVIPQSHLHNFSHDTLYNLREFLFGVTDIYVGDMKQ